MNNRVFWAQAFAIRGSVTSKVMPRVIAFGAFAWLAHLLHDRYVDIGIAVGPVEIAGAVLALLLVLRTNAGYDRWWEARKLWGGIVNQCRNVAITSIANGPDDPDWRAQVTRWTASFAHVARRSLRGERDLPEVAALVGDGHAREIAEAAHMPSHVALRIGLLLREAREDGMDVFAYQIAEKERATLIDHIGGCERILRTPLPLVYAIKIRRILILYLAALPFALLDRVAWLAPVVTMLAAYAILGVDQIAVELENPFSVAHLSHLPLDEICANIERSVLGVLTSDSMIRSGDGLALPAVESRVTQ